MQKDGYDFGLEYSLTVADSLWLKCLVEEYLRLESPQNLWISYSAYYSRDVAVFIENFYLF